MKTIKNFLSDESGLEIMEWALVAGLVGALAAVIYASGLGTTLKGKIETAIGTTY